MFISAGKSRVRDRAQQRRGTRSCKATPPPASAMFSCKLGAPDSAPGNIIRGRQDAAQRKSLLSSSAASFCFLFLFPFLFSRKPSLPLFLSSSILLLIHIIKYSILTTTSIGCPAPIRTFSIDSPRSKLRVTPHRQHPPLQRIT